MERPTLVSDAGKAASDAINMHVAALGVSGAVGKWVAIRLSDGGSDGVLYDLKADAVRHQLHEMLCTYVCIPPGGSTPEDMTRFLAITRNLYDNGFRMSDPDAPEPLSRPDVQPREMSSLILPRRVRRARRQ